MWLGKQGHLQTAPSVPVAPANTGDSDCAGRCRQISCSPPTRAALRLCCCSQPFRSSLAFSWHFSGGSSSWIYRSSAEDLRLAGLQCRCTLRASSCSGCARIWASGAAIFGAARLGSCHDTAQHTKPKDEVPTPETHPLRLPLQMPLKFPSKKNKYRKKKKVPRRSFTARIDGEEYISTTLLLLPE